MTDDKQPPMETIKPPEADDKPPKSRTPRNTAKKEASKPRAGRPSGTANRGTVKGIEDTLNELLAFAGMTAAASGNFEASVIINSRGPRVASAWAELARVNPAVKRVLEKMMQGGVWGGVIFSTASLVVPVANTYGILPAGVPNPFTLSPDEAEQLQSIHATMQAMAARETARNN